MIEQKLAPLIESLFPQHYRESGPNFVAFVKAYYEFLDENFQIIRVKDATGFDVGNTVTQGDTTGTITSKTGNELLVHIDGFNTFKCITMCTEIIPVISSTGASTLIEAGGVTKRLGVNYWSRKLQDIGDVDRTLDVFILKFKEKYLKNINFNTSTNKPLLIKNSLDLYRSKGTARSIDLFFRLVYGSSAAIYYPGDDLFSTSNAEWYRPIYLEVYTPNSNRIIAMIGKQIQGVTSEATAFVERYIKRRAGNGFVHVLYISNIVGEFIPNELLKSDALYADSPKVLGSLNTVSVINGSTAYEVGNVVDIYSTTGSQAKARIVEVNGVRGVVSFELLKQGWGFTTTNTTISEVSDIVLGIDNIQSSNTDGRIYQLFETVTQPAAKATYSGIYTYNTNDAVTIRNGASVVNTGFVRDQLEGTSSNGTIDVMLNNQYNIANGMTICLTSNTLCNVLITDCYNNSATGRVLRSPVVTTLSVQTPSLNFAFNTNDIVRQIINNVEVANGVIDQAVVTVAGGSIQLNNVRGLFRTGAISNDTSTANVVSVSSSVGLYQSNNTFYNGYRTISSHSNTTANVVFTSTGEDASFDINSINKVESVRVDTKALNTFANTIVNSWSSTLYDQMSYDSVSLGSVDTIGNINPGTGYTVVPEYNLYNLGVAALDRGELKLTVANSQSSFSVGEQVEQIQVVPQYSFTTNTALFSVGERVHIGNTVIVYAANGTVVSKTPTTLNLVDVEGSFSPTHRITRFANSQQNTAFTASNISTFDKVTKGTITSIVSNVLTVERNSLYNDFTYSTITGLLSGANATIVNIEELGSNIIGQNAEVDLNVFTANGTVVELQVLDSGYGFANNQVCIFTNAINDDGTVRSSVRGIGTGSGYYRSNKGFTSDSSKLQDGDYYQEYSYDIISRIPFNLYSEMFKKVMHTAGTKFFGNLLIDTVNSNKVNMANTAIDITELSPFVLYANNVVVEERDGDTVELRP